MQVHKKKWSVLTSFVSWKSKILFFQIRTLTGFWFCILNWFRSSFKIFSVMLVCVGILHPENNWITDQESCYLKTKKHTWENKVAQRLTWWPRALQVFALRKNTWTQSVQYFGSLNTAGLFFFPQVLLQRLTSCRVQCLFVQIFWVSAGSLAISLDNLCWSCTGFKTCSRQREKKTTLCSRRQTFLQKTPKNKTKKN